MAPTTFTSRRELRARLTAMAVDPAAIAEAAAKAWAAMPAVLRPLEVAVVVRDGDEFAYAWIDRDGNVVRLEAVEA